MMGIPPELNNRLCTTLLRCEAFESDRALRAVFADARIDFWRHRVPHADSPDERVKDVVDYLHRRTDEHGENALVLLLRVLGEQMPPTDARHRELAVLADDLEHEFKLRPPKPEASRISAPRSLGNYVYDVSATIKRATEWFVGREFIFEWLSQHLQTLPCGYLRLVADAGLGKTAIAAEIARRYDALIHFVNASNGFTRPDQCLNHLSARLIERYNLPYDELPEGAGQDAGFLLTLLQEVVEGHNDQSILLVIDALDEADPVDAGHNWLHLPDHLPQGVFVLLTHRPGVYPISSDAQTPQPKPLIITWDDQRQQTDITAHLNRQAERPQIRRALEEATPPVSVEQFVDALQTASEGNFMYLDYILADIAERKPGFAPLDIQNLPYGLMRYYEHFWRQMRPKTETEAELDAWSSRHLPILESLGVAREPVTVDWLADHTDLSERIVLRILVDWQRFLRAELQADGLRTWRIIHRSFADFLAGKEEVKLSVAHRRIAAHYLDAWGGWEAGLPDLSTAADYHNGYGLRHLASHLSDAGCWELLHALFTTDAWLLAQLADEKYAYFGYLADLELAWRRAEEETRQQIAADESPDALTKCVRYALIYTTINSLAINYVPELVVRAVEVGLWSPARAFNIAVKKADAEQAAKICTLLLGTSALTPEQRRVAQKIGLTAARGIGSSLAQAKALAALAAQLTGEMREAVLKEGLATAQSIANWGNDNDKVIKVEVLAMLASQMTGEAREAALAEGLTATRGIYKENQAEALAALVPQLTGEAREFAVAEGLKAAQEICDAKDRAKALTILAPHLTEAQLLELMEDLVAGIFAEARQEKNTGHYSEEKTVEDYTTALAAKVLAGLVPYLTNEAQQIALVEGLAAGLTEAWKTRKHLSRFEEIKVTEYDCTAALAVEALTALALDSSGEVRQLALDRSLAAVQEIQDEAVQAKALAELIPHLTGDLLVKARTIQDAGGDLDVLATAFEIWKQHPRARAFSALTPRLTKSARQTFSAAVRYVVPDTYPLTEALSTLVMTALHFLSAWLVEKLATARWLGYKHQRSMVTAALGLSLRSILSVWQLAESSKTRGAYCHAAALAATIPSIKEEGLSNALARVQNAEYGRVHAKALAALAPFLPETLLAKALVMVEAIDHKSVRREDINVRASVAAALTLYRSEAWSERTLTEWIAASRKQNSWIWDFDDNDDYIEALAALVPSLKGRTQQIVLAEVMAVPRGIRERAGYADILVKLTPYLRGYWLAEGVAAAQEITQVDCRLKTLTRMTLYLTDDIIRKDVVAEVLLATARKTGNRRDYVEALETLAPHLTIDLLSKELVLSSKIEDVMEQIQCLDTLALQSTGVTQNTVLTESLAALCEIGNEQQRVKALTSLIPQLNGDLLAEGLTMVQEIQSEKYRTQALMTLIPQLSEDLLEKGLAVARNISDENYRVQALEALAPRLSMDELTDELTTTWSIKDKQQQAKMLAVLVPRRSTDLLAKGLTTSQVLVALAPQLVERAETIAALVPHLDGELLAEGLAIGLAVARKTRHVSDKAYLLTALAPHLYGELLTEGLTAAQKIRPAKYRVEVLAALIPKLTGEAQRNALMEGLAAVRKIEDEHNRVLALTSLATHLSGDLLLKWLEVAREIISNRMQIWEALAPNLASEFDGELLTQGLAVAREIGYEWDRVEALVALAPKLAEDIKYTVLAEVLTVVREEIFDKEWWEIDEGYQVPTLVKLAPHLRGELLAEALEMVRENKCLREHNAQALIALIPNLSKDLLAEELEIMRESRWFGEYQMQVLTALAPYLCEDLLAEGLALVREIDSNTYQVQALAALAPHLSEDLLAEELALVQEVYCNEYASYELFSAELRVVFRNECREQALAVLVPQLSGDLLMDGLAAVRKIDSDRRRAQVLLELIPLPSDTEAHTVQREYQIAVLNALRIAKHQQRKQVLELLADKGVFSPGALALTSQAIADIATAIGDVCGRWIWA